MNYQDIKPYIEKKLVSEQKHPEDSNVRIFNYTQTCQFEGVWDDITRQCRGLIMNIATGEVLARPFPKFFNYQEHIEKGWGIPEEDPIITEKLDGSLGIMYCLNGKTRIATRGSFTSEQAEWATKWWWENKGDEPYGNTITYLFEIIYPENRIVVSYDFSGLVHIASIQTSTGMELLNEIMPVKKAKEISNKNLVELLKLEEPNSEGFVILYPKSNLRIKIKFAEYVRLHKLITGVNEIAIWEHLRDGNNLEDLLSKVPDEFFKWVEGVQNRLKSEFTKIWEKANLAVSEVENMPTRKEQALWIMENVKPVSGIAFSILDKKINEARMGVWRIIRPKGQSVFKTDIDL